MYLIALDMRLYSVANAMEIDRIAFLIASLPRPSSVLNCTTKNRQYKKSSCAVGFFTCRSPAAEAAGPKKERGLGVSRLGTILAPNGQALVIRHTAGDCP